MGNCWGESSNTMKKEETKYIVTTIYIENVKINNLLQSFSTSVFMS
jgi:hypothetical protein